MDASPERSSCECYPLHLHLRFCVVRYTQCVIKHYPLQVIHSISTLTESRFHTVEGIVIDPLYKTRGPDIYYYYFFFCGGCVIQGMNLDGVDLSDLDLRNINFKCTSLSGCNLSNCDLTNCVFERADLSKSNLDVS